MLCYAFHTGIRVMSLGGEESTLKLVPHARIRYTDRFDARPAGESRLP